MFSKLQEALALAGAELIVLRDLKSDLSRHESHGVIAILRRLDQIESTIMSAISTFAAAQNKFNDRQDAAIDGLVADVKNLNDKITELQNSSGAVTAEDQASLDALQARGEAISAKLEALNDLTPPVPPTA